MNQGISSFDDLAKSQKMYFFVIPAKAGIQSSLGTLVYKLTGY